MEQLLSQDKNVRLSKRTYFSALLGVFLEYVDYALYGFSAPYLAKTFFPTVTPATELILSWGIFAVSFLVRPVGAIIFGHLADRFGRRSILTYTILLMSFSTILIGCLPTFQQVGILAPILLLACRVLQGLAVSTEYSGCSTYLLEFKKDRPGLVSGIITSASGFGVFGASLLVLAFSSSSVHIINLDNWRLPFIVGGIVVGVLGFYFRRGLLESPSFLDIQKQNKIVKFPFFYLLKKYPKTLIKTILISAYVGVTIIVIEIYLPSYFQTHFGMLKEKALQLTTYLSFMEAVCAILWGAFSDRLGSIKTLWMAGVLMIICIFPLLFLLHQTSLLLWILGATGLAIIIGAADGPLSAFLTKIFPTEIRYTGVSLSYNLGAGVIGGLSPAILVLLQNQVNISGLFSWYIIVGAFIMLIALSFK